MTLNVLVLGAGFGGLEVASLLSGSLADQVRVTLIDQADSFVFGFSKLEIMFGRTRADDVRMYYRDFVKEGVDLRQERVTSIDPNSRRVTTDRNTYEPDVLVVALGADYDPGATPGFVEGGYEFYSIAGAERVADVLETFDGGKIVVAILRPPFKCPPAPFEATLLLHDYLSERGVRDNSEIRFITPLDSPIPFRRKHRKRSFPD